jgi:hypothetical protein
MKEVILIGDLRNRLNYRSREAMICNWRQVFPNINLPEDHVAVDAERVLIFLKSMGKPQRGRSAAITNAAIDLFNELTTIEKAQPSSKEVSETSMEVPAAIEKVNEVLPNKENGLVTFLKGLTMLDVVFFTNVAVADYGLCFLMKEMGIAWGFIYTLVSFHALGMAKNRKSQVTAQYGIMAVWVLEILSFFIHLSMFNLRVWQAAKHGELPFNAWENQHVPFYIAALLAALFSTSAIYAVSITLALTKEKIEAENYERNYGIQY